MPKFNKISFSNILILISLIFTIIWYLNLPFINEWSINNTYLNNWNYFHWLLQFITWTFLHGWAMHFLMNSIFVYYFGNILEIIIWKLKYISFFILFVIFNWLILSYVEPYTSTIWISWFALAILTYYTLKLKSINDPEYKWWITAIIINIWIWFYPWISMFWHLNWVIFWIIFFYLTNDFFKRQIVWLFKYLKSDNKIKNYWTLNTKKD